MNRNELRPISEKEREEARFKALTEIRRKRRTAAGCRLIAEKFKGKHITKRFESDLIALFPSAAFGYMKQDSRVVELVIMYARGDYNNCDYITLCTPENRRLDGAKLIDRADALEKEAAEMENALAGFDTAVAAYNVLAARYVEVYVGLSAFFRWNLPSPDYTMEKRCREAREAVECSPVFTMTPDEFAASA